MLKIVIPMISLMMMSQKSFMITHTVTALAVISLMSLPLWVYNMKMFNPMMMADPLSTPLITLTLWITLMMVLASIKTLNATRLQHLYLNSMTVLGNLLIISFMCSSLLSFFIFFEASLIPTMFIILTWGYQPERIQASFYLMLYTVCGSLPLLLSLLMINKTNYHLSIALPMLSTPTSSTTVWWMMTITAFLIKMPIYGVHLWLPKAHVEAPVAGSMILAGTLLKLGGYGLMRLSAMFQSISIKVSSTFIPLTLIGATMASFICLRQSDLKSMIAYSSVSHMGMMTAGIMTNTLLGWQGAMLMMVAHGLTSSGLFAAANMTYELTNTRSVFLTKGLLTMFPTLSLLWFLLAAANMAAPPTLNLMSEIALISAILQTSSIMSAFLFMLVFLAAAYSLHLFTAANHGHPLSFTHPSAHPTKRNSLVIGLHLYPAFLLFLSPSAFML